MWKSNQRIYNQRIYNGQWKKDFTRIVNEYIILITETKDVSNIMKREEMENEKKRE